MIENKKVKKISTVIAKQMTYLDIAHSENEIAILEQ